jgi:hypothetical protein
MNICIPVVACSILASLGINSGPDAGGTVVRRELETNQRTAPWYADSPLHQVRAYVEVDTVQRDASQGLEFLVEIVNQGERSVDLVHRDDAFDIYLYDEKGVRIDVPHHKGLAYKRSGPRPPIPPERKPYIVLPPRDAKDRASDVVELPKLQWPEEYNDLYYSLAPGKRQQFRIRITNVLAEPEKWWAEMEKRSGKPPSGLGPPAPPAVTPIPPGTYQLWVYMSLRVPQQPGWGPSMPERVTVRLGTKADEGQ